MTSTTHLLKLVGATGATMFALDLLWLGVVAKGFYARHMGDLRLLRSSGCPPCCSICCT